jgi:hypothetical protein
MKINKNTSEISIPGESDIKRWVKDLIDDLVSPVINDIKTSLDLLDAVPSDLEKVITEFTDETKNIGKYLGTELEVFQNSISRSSFIGSPKFLALQS